MYKPHLSFQEPVVYDVQLVGDSMLLRMSKFIERIPMSTQRCSSLQWQHHSLRTPLESRSPSTGSITDIFSDSTATSTDCESPVSSSSVTHLGFEFRNKHDRFEDTSANSPIHKSQMIPSNETPRTVKYKPSMLSTDGSSTTVLNNIPPKISSSTLGDSPTLRSVQSAAYQLRYKSPITNLYNSQPPFSMYHTHDAPSKSATLYQIKGRQYQAGQIMFKLRSY
jgi:hypothetical protein